MSFNNESIIAFAHDYETTGVVIKELGVVQAALCIVRLHQDGSYEILEQDVQNLNPGVPIEAEAAAIHGLSDFDVADCPPWKEYMREQMETVNEYGCQAVLSFNGGRFDNKIAASVGWKPVPSLDLYKWAALQKKNKVWEKANLGYSYEKTVGKPLENAHNAFADITACLEMLPLCIIQSGKGTLDEFHKHIQGDDGTPEMKFSWGKNKGKKLKHVETGYIRWCLSKDCDMEFSHEFETALRACLV